ncbi:hypothetical protein [Bacillus taeanensis]|uniref:Uncharacterized protein n=1 Tax=Bacillus taeanensis TaxID=273032 RepID=A0A366XQD3_9BACI|nr:hypothetical protein [Bacillus taeanensis]RBW68322.1 hypothetical protein DS031_17540 [Bacillus taeanensis]
MNSQVNGLMDIYTIVSNERKVGGAIEAEKIQLRSGEVFDYPVITNLDYSGSVFYHLSFITDSGSPMMVHVNDISLIASPVHKKVCDLKNHSYKKMKTEEKIHYLKLLCTVNEGSYTKPFIDEVKAIIQDIGYHSLKQDQDFTFIAKEKQLFKIA